MLRFITRHKILIFYLAAYFFAISITLRYIFYYQDDASLIKVISLLAAFLILLVIQTWLRDRSQLYTHIILAVQTGIVVILSLLPPRFDFFSTLFVTLALQAVCVQWKNRFSLDRSLRRGRGCAITVRSGLEPRIALSCVKYCGSLSGQRICGSITSDRNRSSGESETFS